MNSSSPIISAVIIAKNEERTIRRCIGSVLAQSVPVAEIVVVVGRSTDSTLRQVNELAANDRRIIVVSDDPKEPGHGPAAARNTGAAVASGGLIFFLNGDVTVGPDYLRHLLETKTERQLDAVAGLRWNVRNSLVSGLMNVHYALNYDSSRDTQLSPAFLSGDAMLIESEAFWSAGGYDSGMPAGEDADLGYRLRGMGKQIGYNGRATIWHEGRHYRSVADWFQQLKWYGSGAASLAKAHDWRMQREKDGLFRHIISPFAALLGLLLVAAIAVAALGSLAWVAGAVAFTAIGARYIVSAARVQAKCGSVDLPSRLEPGDILLYPLFKSVRYAALSAFTWQALLELSAMERKRQTEDGVL